MSGLPSYDDVVGPSSGAPTPAHPQAGSNTYPSASDEKKQQQQQQYAAPPTAHAHHGSSASREAKVLKIWHAASGNSLLTAADEQTPIYNVIDSRAPDEQAQRQQSDKMHAQYESQQGSGVTRRDPHSQEVPGDVEFARQVAHSRANPNHGQQQQPNYAQLWSLRVRRGGDRNGPVLATIKRHVNTNSAVGIELDGTKTGIEQHSGFPHTKYEFKWHGKVYNWQKTHNAPGTSRLDSGNFVCRDQHKTVYAYSTSEDSRCDGSLQFEDRAVQEGLLDIMTITGFIMRDLDDERNHPSYMSAPYGAGYGPYANPYYSAGYGFYPSPMLGMGFPLLL